MMGDVQLTATVRDKEYMPAPDAKVAAHVIGPDGASTLVDMTPVPNDAGDVSGGVDGGEAGVLSCRR